MKDVQDFVEAYYPDYSRSQEIADEGDLFKILFDRESMEEGDCSYNKEERYTQEDHDNNQPLIDWQELRIGILEKCIEEFLESDFRKSIHNAAIQLAAENAEADFEPVSPGLKRIMTMYEHGVDYEVGVHRSSILALKK